MIFTNYTIDDLPLEIPEMDFYEVGVDITKNIRLLCNKIANNSGLDDHAVTHTIIRKLEGYVVRITKNNFNLMFENNKIYINELSYKPSSLCILLSNGAIVNCNDKTTIIGTDYNNIGYGEYIYRRHKNDEYNKECNNEE